MNKPRVERLQTYAPEYAAGIGRLMPYLSERLSDEPMDEQLLRTIIESPLHDQFVAQIDKRIVGSATLSVVMGPAANKQMYLSDFVADPDPSIKGVGSALWASIDDRCRELSITKLIFTSGKKRIEAHHFYDKKGAVIRTDTDAYLKVFSWDDDRGNDII